jgi:hypothetical protein
MPMKSLDEWARPAPWLECDTCGKGRAELRRNLLFWIPLCNLTPDCEGTLRQVKTLPAIERRRP